MDFFLWACALAMFASFVSPGFAQEALLEKFSPQERETADESENILQELLGAPLDLNCATPAELQRLPFLSRRQIDTFVAQRKNEIYFSKIEEALAALQVHGDTLALCRAIFKASPPPSRPSEKSWSAHLLWRSGRPANIDGRWPGPKYRSYQRLLLQRKNMQAGLLLERDAGESRWDDHRVFYLKWQQYADRGWQIIAGNYQIEWGHGLAFWSPYRTGITSDVQAPARRWGRGVRPFLSAYENFSLCGATVWQRWRALHFLAFAGRQKYDAHLRQEEYAVRYRDSGYHRSAAEIAARKNLVENAGGGGIVIGEGMRSLGLLLYASRYSRAWQVDDPGVDHFAFTGKRNAVASITGSWREQELFASFEIAASQSGGKAGSLAFAAEYNHWAWALAFHHAEVDFHSPHGLSPADDDRAPAGSTGYEAGLSFRPVKAAHAEFFHHHSQNLWRTSALPLPSRRRRWGCNFEWRGPAQAHFILRYYRSGSEYLLRPPDRPFALQLPQELESVRFELRQRFSRKIEMRPRLDFARESRQQMEMLASQSMGAAETAWRRQNIATPWGMALSLDFTCRLSPGVQLSFRQAIFDTSVPIYAYENDLPGVFTVQALRERGARRYIYVHLQAWERIGMSGKIAETEARISALQTHKSFSWNAQIDWAF